MSRTNVTVYRDDAIPPRPMSTAAGNFDDFANEVWSMMDEMAHQQIFRSSTPTHWQPRVNFYETTSRYLLCVELAGMSCSQIGVRVAERTLSISGVRLKPGLPDEEGAVSVHAMEIDSGRFQRELSLPEDVDTERISAQYRQGYLWITIPRSLDAPDSDDR